MSWRSRRRNRRGFSLLEALVALTVVLAFAAALGPVLLQARRIVAGANDRVAAQILLRALLADPVDAATLSTLARNGESEGLQWRVQAEPSSIVASFPAETARAAAPDPAQERPNWVAYRVVAQVFFGQNQSISAETVRLGKAPQ